MVTNIIFSGQSRCSTDFAVHWISNIYLDPEDVGSATKTTGIWSVAFNYMHLGIGFLFRHLCYTI